MRFWPSLLAVLAVVLLAGGSLAACGGEGPGPEDTVRGAVKAMGDRDGEKMASYFVEDMRAELEEGMEFFFAMIDEIKISNIETRLVSESGDSAVVEMEFDFEITAFDETETEHMEDTAELVKVDGKWLIHDETFFE
jgi:hypothetical protein